MAPVAIPAHVPTAGEIDSHIVEKIAQDGTCTVLDQATGLRTTVRLGVIAVGGQLTLVAIGAGSG